MVGWRMQQVYHTIHHKNQWIFGCIWC